MSIVLEKVAQRRFTVEEYHRMAGAGILAPSERVELIRGVVRQMSPKNREHVVAAHLVFRFLQDALSGRASVYLESPLVVERIDSEPEPDVLVCSNPDISAYGTERTTPLMVIEVAESSLAYDVNEKASLYAEAGIPEYWVLNLVDRTLEVFRQLDQGAYRERFTVESRERVVPQAWPDLECEVSSFLPK